MIINSPIIQNTGSLVTIDGQKVTDALDLYGFNETVTISSDTSLLVSPDISYKEYLLNNNNNLYIKTITNNENNNFKFDIQYVNASKTKTYAKKQIELTKISSLYLYNYYIYQSSIYNMCWLILIQYDNNNNYTYFSVSEIECTQDNLIIETKCENIESYYTRNMAGNSSSSRILDWVHTGLLVDSTGLYAMEIESILNGATVYRYHTLTTYQFNQNQAKKMKLAGSPRTVSCKYTDSASDMFGVFKGFGGLYKQNDNTYYYFYANDGGTSKINTYFYITRNNANSFSQSDIFSTGDIWTQNGNDYNNRYQIQSTASIYVYNNDFYIFRMGASTYPSNPQNTSGYVSNSSGGVEFFKLSLIDNKWNSIKTIYTDLYISRTAANFTQGGFIRYFRTNLEQYTLHQYEITNLATGDYKIIKLPALDSTKSYTIEEVIQDSQSFQVYAKVTYNSQTRYERIIMPASSIPIFYTSLVL